MNTGTLVFLSSSPDEQHAGGWAALLRCGTHERVISGCVMTASSLETELHAAIEALAAIREGTAVRVVGGSASLIKGASEYLPAWKKNEWKNKAGEPIKQCDLWRKMSDLTEAREVEWMPARSLVGQAAWNETLVRAASLAEQACDEAKDVARSICGEGSPATTRTPVEVAASLPAEAPAIQATFLEAEVKRLKVLLNECLAALSAGVPVPVAVAHAPESLVARVAAEVQGGNGAWEGRNLLHSPDNGRGLKH